MRLNQQPKRQKNKRLVVDPKLDTPIDDAAVARFATDYGEQPFTDVVVLIAAYNEAGAIGDVLDEMPPTVCDLAVTTLVVTDGCEDGTAAVVREHQGGRTRALVCEVTENRGQGAALRLGYRLAREGGVRFIVTTDADGQYHLEEMPALVGPLVAGTADFVTGSRRLGYYEVTDTVRRHGVHVFARVVSILTGQHVTDTSFGMRAMRAEITGEITLKQQQYQSSELLIGLISHGFRVLEVPGTFRRRASGKSKKGNNFIYGVRYGRVVLGTWLREGRRGRAARRSRSIAADASSTGNLG
ncbi:MAG: glycosyltransferase family 2 protein [Mycobacteriales bacterium]